jgi:hypothetical protein
MRPQSEFDAVMSLVASGRSDTEIARATGIPRTTVRDWRSGRGGILDRARAGGSTHPHDFRRLPSGEYSYLLGLYLGDGYVARSQRVWKLGITLDEQYPGVIDECAAAMEAIMPGQTAHRLPRQTRCIEVSMYSRHWPCLFPQHGPGRKHERDIRLADWQERLVDRPRRQLLRGLIHSDGCRVETLDRGVPSVRYHFSNRSEDIKQIFCDSLNQLGITWTRPTDIQIAIYRKAAVAKLDRFIGPKT